MSDSRGNSYCFPGKTTGLSVIQTHPITLHLDTGWKGFVFGLFSPSARTDSHSLQQNNTILTQTLNQKEAGEN